MKKTMLVCLAACGLLAQGGFAQTTYYVAANGANNYPYTNSWADAATNIHDAVTAAANGGTILVTNGWYRLTNTLVIATNITIQSMNGPDATTLYRSTTNNYGLLIVSNASALVAGFTLTNGYVSTVQGGALYIYSGTVSNCVITKCQSVSYGEANAYLSGGLLTGCIFSNNIGNEGAVIMVGGVMEDCTIITNTAIGGNNGFCGGLAMSAGVARRCRIIRNNGAGTSVAGVLFNGGRIENSLIAWNMGPANVGGIQMAGGVVVNCTIVGNVVSSGFRSGVYRTGGTITNSIIHGNGLNGSNDNYYGAANSVWHSCAPELTTGVQGNVAVDPKFMNAASGDFHLPLGSPCLDAGTNVASIVNDLDGNSRPLVGYAGSTLRHDIGAYEKDGTHGALEVGMAGAPVSGFDSVQCVFSARVSGSNTTIAWYGWDFTNGGAYDPALVNFGVVTNIYGPGRYSVSLRVTNSVGETAACTNLNYVLVVASNVCVSPNGGNVVPYNTWANAATNIHDAVAVALPGCTVWVTNGSYRLTNQISVYSGFAVRGVNGPEATTLWRDATFGNFGLFDVRDTGALVAGLTVTNGYATSVPGGGVRLVAGTVRRRQ